MTQPMPDRDAVVRVLLSETMCVLCIMLKTGLKLDPVLNAIVALEGNRRLVRKWGRCRMCSKTGCALLTVASRRD
jgi:hypothetical protein